MNFQFFIAPHPIVWIIGFCAVIALAVFFNRLYRLRNARIDHHDFLQGIFGVLAKGGVHEALALCDESPGPIVQLTKTAILNREAASEELSRLLDNTARAEVARMERRIVIIATVAQCTPLLGLLGTLLGALSTLIAVRSQGVLVQTIDLTNGLFDAIVCAIAGIAVALPTYVMYSILDARINRIVIDIEEAKVELLAFFKKQSR